MLDEGKDPEQINIQFKSIDKGIQKAHYLLLDEVYRKALAIGIVKAVDSCPGNCGNEDKIEYFNENAIETSEFIELKQEDDSLVCQKCKITCWAPIFDEFFTTRKTTHRNDCV
mgnify:CR=1 FL=1